MADDGRDPKRNAKQSFLQKIENGNMAEKSSKLFEELIGKKFQLSGINNLLKDDTMSQIKKHGVTSLTSYTPRRENSDQKCDAEASNGKKKVIEAREIRIKEPMPIGTRSEVHTPDDRPKQKNGNNGEHLEPFTETVSVGNKHQNHTKTGPTKNFLANAKLSFDEKPKNILSSDLANPKNGLNQTKSTKDPNNDKNVSPESSQETNKAKISGTDGLMNGEHLMSHYENGKLVEDDASDSDHNRDFLLDDIKDPKKFKYDKNGGKSQFSKPRSNLGENEIPEDRIRERIARAKPRKSLTSEYLYHERKTTPCESNSHFEEGVGKDKEPTRNKKEQEQF